MFTVRKSGGLNMKRKDIIEQWERLIVNRFSRINYSLFSFRKFKDVDSLDGFIEDCEKLLEAAKNAKKAFDYMDKNNIN